MKKTLFVLSIGLLSGSVLEGANLSAKESSLESTNLSVKGTSLEHYALSESMILNSSAFNLQSAIQEGLLDRESPEYLLIS